MKNVRRILIIKWGALGDLIAGTTAIREVRDHFHDAHITLLSNRLMLDVCPPRTLADDIIVYDPKKKSVKENFQVIRELFKRKFDLAINLRWTSERSAIIGWLSGARFRAGAGPKESRWMYNVKAPLYEGRRHEFLRHLDIVRALGIPAREPQPYIHISDADRAFAKNFLSDHGCTKSSTLIIHPGASIHSKAWVPERFCEIGKRFVDRFNGRVIVTWGREEESLAGTVTEAIGSSASMSPPTTVGKVAALIAGSGLCLCNYSGVMNIGMAVQTPVVALGCTSAEDWGPYGALHRTVNKARERDSYSEAERAEFMRRITVDEVWEVVEQRWAELYTHPENASVN